MKARALTSILALVVAFGCCQLPSKVVPTSQPAGIEATALPTLPPMATETSPEEVLPSREPESIESTIERQLELASEEYRSVPTTVDGWLAIWEADFAEGTIEVRTADCGGGLWCLCMDTYDAEFRNKEFRVLLQELEDGSIMLIEADSRLDNGNESNVRSLAENDFPVEMAAGAYELVEVNLAGHMATIRAVQLTYGRPTFMFYNLNPENKEAVAVMVGENGRLKIGIFR